MLKPMNESGVFEHLVKELLPLERKELLDKLCAAVKVEPVKLSQKTPEEDVDLEKEFFSMGFFSRLVVALKAFFRNEDKLVLTEELVLKKIEREVKSEGSNIVSLKTGRLLPGFRTELERLAQSAWFFAPYIRSVCGSGREEFLIYLGSIHIPVIHQQLMRDTDFEYVESDSGLVSGSDVRKEVFFRIETCLGKIAGDLRKSMYAHSQLLYLFEQFIRFDFAGLADLFNDKSQGMSGECYFGTARNPMEKLASILGSFTVSPDKLFLEAVFLFQNGNLDADNEKAIEEKLDAFLREARKNIEVIRDFNKTVKPQRLMKLVTGNIGYKASRLSGGEDWFNLYSRYWNNLAEQRYKGYSEEKRRQKVYDEAMKFFNAGSLPSLPHYSSTFRFSCGFLYDFIRDEFSASLNEILKRILVDGKFYKKQNKEDYTESYSALLSLYEKLTRFDKSCAPDGEHGQKLEDVEQQMIPGASREKKKADIVKQIDFAAKELVVIGNESLFTMKMLLHGILHGRAGGRYDSLSNLNRMVGLQSRDFIYDLNNVYIKIDNASRIISELFELENSGF